MEDHKHCKRCKVVIEKPLLWMCKNYATNCELYCKLEVCIDCVIKEGIKSLQKKSKKKKPEGMEFGKND